MIISLVKNDDNGAHEDHIIYLDGTLSGTIRLWKEEVDRFVFFVEMWNSRNGKSGKALGYDKGDVPVEILEIEAPGYLPRHYKTKN